MSATTSATGTSNISMMSISGTPKPSIFMKPPFREAFFNQYSKRGAPEEAPREKT